jgi:hypothetical protein
LILAASELMTPPIQMVTHLNPPLLHQLLCDTSYVSDMQIIPYIVLKKKLERDPDEKNHTISESSKEARGREDGRDREEHKGQVPGGRGRGPWSREREDLRTEASWTKPCGCRAGHGG